VARNPDARAVAVTGGAGFVGLNIVTALAEAGHAVVALHQSPLDSVAESVWHRYDGSVVFVHCDVREEHALTTVLSEYDVVDVVHAAAITSPAHESTLAMLDVNLRTTQVLLDFAAEQPLRRLVFVSSAGVFRSAESVTPLDEAFPVTMEHPYAIFKVAAERLVAFGRRERQVDATSVRLGFVYGPYERPTSSRTAMSSVYDAVALARRGEPIVAIAPGVGRDWIHAGDVARGVRMVLDHEGPLAPLYHLGTGRNSTMRETMEMIAALIPGTVLRWTDNASQANVVVSEENRRAPLGFARAKADFGFAPAFSLAEGLRDYIAFLENDDRNSA
jgi:nucleoside-diphosphate-sugar epimerase